MSSPSSSIDISNSSDPTSNGGAFVVSTHVISPSKNKSTIDTSSTHFRAAVQGAKIMLENLNTCVGGVIDLESEDMRDTAKRHVKALLEMLAGHLMNVDMTTFARADTQEDNLVFVGAMPFKSLCKHHLLPFYGTAYIAYVPKDKILGLSKFARVVKKYATRFQVQEDLTSQICDDINTVLEPHGVGVIMEGRHTCMLCRGAESPGVTITQDLKGVLKTNEILRKEFMDHVKFSRHV